MDPRLPRKAHKQSPFFGTLWAIFMIRGPLTINTFHSYSVSYIQTIGALKSIPYSSGALTIIYLPDIATLNPKSALRLSLGFVNV